MFEENQIEYWVQKEILSKITELLERKHLYQSVSLDREALNQKVQEIEQSKRWATKEELEWEGSDTTESLEERKAASLELSNRVTDMLLTNAWKFEVETCVNPSDAIARRESVRQSSSVHVTVLPLIKITCNHCKGILPAHVSGCLETWAEIPTYNPKGEDASESFLQIFNFPYQCQNCRGEPVVFIVRREGLKLTLVGRSLFEKVTVPESIPKQERRFYNEAIIAIDAGRVLAGLFFLRTCLEQYMRRVLKLTEADRRTGDELGEAYAKLLDEDFPKRCKSLKVVYSDLSAKLHAAEDDHNQFEESLQDIQKHFELLKHIPLKKAP